MKKLALLSIIAALVPEPATACHRHSYWGFHFPQQCGAAHKQVYAAHKFVSPPAKRAEADFDIPLPFLDARDFGGGKPDEVTSARLQLLGYAHAR
jgi:hypothetical protein